MLNKSLKGDWNLAKSKIEDQAKLQTKVHKIRIYPTKEFVKIYDKYLEYSVFCFNRSLKYSTIMFQAWLNEKKENERNKTPDKRTKNKFPNMRALRDVQKPDRKPWESLYGGNIIEFQAGNVAKAWDNFRNENMPQHGAPKKKSLTKTKLDKFSSVVLGLSVNKEKKDYFENIGNNVYFSFPKPKAKNSLQFPKVKLAEKPRFGYENMAETVTVKREGGKYYLIFTFSKMLKPNTGEGTATTGIDLNISHFDYKDSKGKYAKFELLDDRLANALINVKKISKQLSRKRNEFKKLHPDEKFIPSNNYTQTQNKLNNAYDRAVNIATDKIRKFVKSLVKTHSKIIIEDLNIEGMKMNKKLSKSLHRSNFGRFRELLIKKCEEYGIELIIVDRFYPSTQRCSKCGFVKTGEDKLGLSGDRHGNSHHEYKCFNCGADLDRSTNSVENLEQYTPELMKEIKEIYWKK